jgi:hypothetical protein
MKVSCRTTNAHDGGLVCDDQMVSCSESALGLDPTNVNTLGKITMSHLFSNPLFSRKRSGITEEIVHGTFFCQDGNEVAGGENFPVITSGLLLAQKIQALETNPEDLKKLAALAAGKGLPYGYFDALKIFAEQIGIGESDLICPRSSHPRDVADKDQMLQSRFFHGGALAHVLMVHASNTHGGDPHGYWREGHPSQENIYSFVGKATSEPTSWCTDDSGLPTAITSAKTLLKVYGDLERDSSPLARTVVEILSETPSALGEKNLFCYEIVRAFPGRLMALTNSNGTLLLNTVNEDQSFGLVLKFASASDLHHAPLGVLAALKQVDSDNPFINELRTYLEAKSFEIDSHGVEVTF